MVLIGLKLCSSASGLSVGRVPASNKRANVFVFENKLFNLCEGCRVIVMAAIPPSAFSAARIRETQRDMKLSKVTKSGGPRTKFFDTAAAAPTPLKYNSKLMNSIWGLYNRYSPHNVKKINEATNAFVGELPQNSGNSSVRSDFLPIPCANLDVWNTINISQSQ